MKQCSKCKQFKSLDCFVKSAKAKDGKHSYCKECMKKAQKQAYLNNIGEYREKAKLKYYKKKLDKTK